MRYSWSLLPSVVLGHKKVSFQKPPEVLYHSNMITCRHVGSPDQDLVYLGDCVLGVCSNTSFEEDPQLKGDKCIIFNGPLDASQCNEIRASCSRFVLCSDLNVY